jgi:hypothetical protein
MVRARSQDATCATQARIELAGQQVCGQKHLRALSEGSKLKIKLRYIIALNYALFLATSPRSMLPVARVCSIRLQRLIRASGTDAEAM